MGFIETINKHCQKISIENTHIYKEIMNAKPHLEAMGSKVKMKNEFDLFDYEVLYNGMLAQNRIENTYEVFLNQHYDLLDYLSYEEKRKMFNNDLKIALKNFPSFVNDEQIQIYIPYLEPFINQRYLNDYQILLLKQHRDYIKKYKVNHRTPIELYGLDIYRTDFSSLQNVYEDQRHLCYYYDPLKTIYIFKKENFELLNHMMIVDHPITEEIAIEDVKTIANNIETYLYRECLEFMKEKNFITDKTYKKVLKKYR